MRLVGLVGGGKDAAPSHSAALNPPLVFFFISLQSSACPLQLKHPRFSESAGNLNIGEGEEVGREGKRERRKEE